ncbi:DEGP2 [Symbiodinium pilosum]|uniref:DEGP2 protein n=1 Tax=Symbiodinium pilosum TaxID=2952 RepID=A0A812U316_SYMPI|nr:DEGP2 [Symbiodinium pilosum]
MDPAFFLQIEDAVSELEELNAVTFGADSGDLEGEWKVLFSSSNSLNAGTFGLLNGEARQVVKTRERTLTNTSSFLLGLLRFEWVTSWKAKGPLGMILGREDWYPILFGFRIGLVSASTDGIVTWQCTYTDEDMRIFRASKEMEPLVVGSATELPRVFDKVRVVGYPVGGDACSVTEGVVSRVEDSKSKPLEEDVCAEAAAYDDRGRQQGQQMVYLAEAGDKLGAEEVGNVVAVQVDAATKNLNALGSPPPSADSRSRSAWREEEAASAAFRAAGSADTEANPPVAIGARNHKELVTLATTIDLIVRNDPLRALDSVSLGASSFWKIRPCENENVVMADLNVHAGKTGWKSTFCESVQALRCRRLRLRWIRGVDALLGRDLKFICNSAVGQWEQARGNDDRPGVPAYLLAVVLRDLLLTVELESPFHLPKVFASQFSTPAGSEGARCFGAGRAKVGSGLFTSSAVAQPGRKNQFSGGRSVSMTAQAGVRKGTKEIWDAWNAMEMEDCAAQMNKGKRFGPGHDPTLWIWKVLMSYRWQRTGHITEAIAVSNLIKRLNRAANSGNQKFLLMVASPAVVSIITKGRASAHVKLALAGLEQQSTSGELFAARCGDFVLARGKGTGSLLLAKSGQRAGASESLVIDYSHVGTAVANFLRN